MLVYLTNDQEAFLGISQLNKMLKIRVLKVLKSKKSWIEHYMLNFKVLNNFLSYTTFNLYKVILIF